MARLARVVAHRPPVRMDTAALASVRNARECGLARANLDDELIRY